MRDEAEVIRIFLSSGDELKYQLLYQVIALAAKRYGPTGATVLKGVMVFLGQRHCLCPNLLINSQKKFNWQMKL
jgi:PII-like signaling protein